MSRARDAAGHLAAGLVGVVAALPAEARAFGAPRGVRVGATIAVRRHALVYVAGIGPTAARTGCEALLAAGARALVSWGVAAGLDTALVPGTCVLASRVVTMPGTSYVPTASWGEDLAARLNRTMPVVRGTLACSDHVLRSIAEKHALADATHGAVAADMESAAIGEAARAANVPWIVLRAVSDDAHTVVPPSVLRAIDEAGHVRATRIVGALAQRPTDLMELVALARGFRAALRTLRAVVAQADPALHMPVDAA